MNNSPFPLEKSPQFLQEPLPYERFLTQGETLLLKGDFLGLKFCDLAERLHPESSDLLYRIGLALSEFGQSKSDKPLMLLACKKFRQALKKQPLHHHAAQALASTLFNLGKTFDRFDFFKQASEAIEALLLHEATLSLEFLAECLVDSAACLLEIGRKEQASDEFIRALSRMERAAQMNVPHHADFWLLYGHLMFEYGELINSPSHYIQAIDYYRRSIHLYPKNGETWFHLGLSLKYLYMTTLDEDHFIKSGECFASAISLQPLDYDTWVEWAHLLLESGRRLKDKKRLITAIDKCQQAHRLKKDELIDRLLYAEALVHRGVLSDSADDFSAAEKILDELLEKEDALADTYAVSGLLLQAMAAYYDELDYSFQAIEKFQEGLKLDRKNHRLWQLLGEAFQTTGFATDDSAMVEKSFYFFHKALFYKQSPDYYFGLACACTKLAELNKQKSPLHMALYYFEHAFQRQQNIIYVRPDWLYEYANALDMMGDKTEESTYYLKAIEILNHVLIVDPQFKDIHHRLAVIYSHLAELESEKEHYLKSLFHFQIATKNEQENDMILIDMALTLTNYAESMDDEIRRSQLFKESEFKLIQAAKQGNMNAYYHLGGLYALMELHDKALFFLHKAKNFDALPDLNEMLQDAWLENLKGLDGFEKLIQQLEQRASS